MIYAQFYQMSIGFVPNSNPPKIDPAYSELIEATGDRSVVIIDARLKHESVRRIAESECKKRGYKAWCIFKGESFTRSSPVSMRYMVYDGAPDNSAMSATYGA